VWAQWKGKFPQIIDVEKAKKPTNKSGWSEGQNSPRKRAREGTGIHEKERVKWGSQEPTTKSDRGHRNPRKGASEVKGPGIFSQILLNHLQIIGKRTGNDEKEQVKWGTKGGRDRGLDNIRMQEWFSPNPGSCLLTTLTGGIVNATHCNTLEHTATHYNIPQHTSALCNTITTPHSQRSSWTPKLRPPRFLMKI